MVKIMRHYLLQLCNLVVSLVLILCSSNRIANMFGNILEIGQKNFFSRLLKIKGVMITYDNSILRTIYFSLT